MKTADRDDAMVRDLVCREVDHAPVLDIHTHIYAPRFGSLLLWGVDELLTYHYLVAEVFRVAPMPYDRFWAMPKSGQADYVWKHLFIERSPVSEACRGVLTVLHELGLNPARRDLDLFRKYFASMDAEAYVETVFRAAHVRSVVMTNDPFDDLERPMWDRGGAADPRFQTALRIDPLLTGWPSASKRLADWGYPVRGDLGSGDLDGVRRFLNDWIARMKPRYMAVSLSPSFRFPEDGPCGRLIEECILPVARQAGIPFALMIGVRRQVNPGLRLAGDGVGAADVQAVSELCMRHPDNRFLVTMLSRQNQHELCVTARKLPNLHVFGCWWFLNNPSMIEEMTRQRFELLGLSHTPQHSDARVLDQLIYKWSHSRAVIAEVLADKYVDLARAGWQVTEAEVRRDVAGLFGGTFEQFCATAKP
ncbi:MAG TPA: glucuronate isomerase [Phycisphaerae bacterium]|nr:glucuronate isomerase [Phycisphaerae bacterium]HRY68510.1 glucuronate isomerase [Phycisphaerae bacterium]HSA25558.1 glucuronate isomerase [Phycisphaerae bacterium]